MNACLGMRSENEETLFLVAPLLTFAFRAKLYLLIYFLKRKGLKLLFKKGEDRNYILIINPFAKDRGLTINYY